MVHSFPTRRSSDLHANGVDDWPGFLGKVGADVLDTIRIAHPLPSDPLDYGA